MVLPVPVPASASRMPPCSMADATAAAIARWPGRDSNSGTARASGPSSSNARSTAGRQVRAAGSSYRGASAWEPSSAMTLSTRRWWRPPVNGVSRNRRTMASARSGGVILAPSVRMFASLCSRDEAGRLEVARRGGPDAVHLVGRHGHADAGAADEDAAVDAPETTRRATQRREVGIVDRRFAVGPDVVDAIAGIGRRDLIVSFRR